MWVLPWQTFYVAALCVGLLLIGVWHIIAGPTTDRIFRDPRNVRLVGIGIVLLALPCLAWPRPYFIVAGIGLVASGLLRAVTPGLNVQIQKRTYPRWVHGCVMVTVAVLAWIAYQRNWLAH